jgi:hypothetical protein
MHYGRMGGSGRECAALVQAVSPRNQLCSSINEPAFPSRPGITPGTARNVGDGRSGATRSSREHGEHRTFPAVSTVAGWRQSDLRPPLALLALLEAIAVAVHFEDVDVVCQPIEQRAGQPLGPEHPGPFVKRQVGGDDSGAALVTLAEDLEQGVTSRNGI